MLPKQERLKERHLFNLVFNLNKKQKQKLSSNLLSLYYLFRRKDINKFQKTNTNELLPKTAFVVGLKVDKRSNKRNLIKRRMRAIYRLLKKRHIVQLDNKPSVLIWVANPPIKEATFEDIKDTMDHLLVKLQNVAKT